ncbi:MAG: hypothetical protein RMJ83_09450 [Armatimonadota bacterium]|nr:hypothetical protein [Armatimonadota bacterium]
MRPTALRLAADATTLRQQHTVLGIRVVCHPTAIPVAWRVLPATQRRAWRPEGEWLLATAWQGVPRGLAMCVLADWGL